jgi:hypothetical protein
MQMLCEQVLKKFQILKYRMKISFSAFSEKMTVHELFLRTILDVYRKRRAENLIRNPWPKENQGILKQIMTGESNLAALTANE